MAGNQTGPTLIRLGTDGLVGGAGGDPISPVNYAAAINVLNPQYGAKGDNITDDTGAIQSAIGGAAAKSANTGGGLVDVWLPAGYGFNIGQLVLANNVRLWAYGAVITPNPALFVNGLITVAQPFSRVEVRGGTWNGTGNESGVTDQFLFYNGFGSNYGSDVLIRDLHVPLWGIGPIYIRNPRRCRIVDNTILQANNVGAQGLNTISVYGSGTPANGGVGEVLMRGNIIEQSAYHGLCYVNNSQAGGGIVQAIIAGNITGGQAGASTATASGGIVLETDPSSGGTFSQFLIHDNIINNPSPNATARGISIGVSGATLAEIDVHDNIIHSAQNGIHYATALDTDLTIHDNRITAPTPIEGTGAASQHDNRFSSGASQGVVTLVGGTATVTTSEVVANDTILLSRIATGSSTAVGELTCAAVTNGSFVIDAITPGAASLLAGDLSRVFWRIVH